MDTNSKNIAIVSYITLIGWIIALIMKNSSNDSNPFTTFHLRQSFGLGAGGFVLSTLLGLVHLWSVIQLVYLLVLILIIVGVLNANGGKEAHLPFVGKFFDEKLIFIQ